MPLTQVVKIHLKTSFDEVKEPIIALTQRSPIHVAALSFSLQQPPSPHPQIMLRA